MTMLVTADWVLPVSRPPIRDGAVLLDDGLVRLVGSADEFGSLLETVAERHHFAGCTITPGLVNAHTHLSLTAMAGVLEPAPFDRWLPRMVAAMRSWDTEDYAASAEIGARDCLEAGVTVVGDIVYGPEGSAAVGRAGLGGVFYWEILGIIPPQLFATLERLGFPATEEGRCGTRARCGLSPHSPYTSGPGLLASLHATAAELDVPFALHVAESAAEIELLLHGTGPLAEVAKRTAHGFEVPGTGPVAYLDRLGVLEGATAVHLCHSEPADSVRLVAASRGGVTCPRSNAYLGNPIPPVAHLLSDGLPIGIGTDSAASNHDLDLLGEVRALHAQDPSIPVRTLVEMATVMGAIALGVEDRFGILEPGMQADLAVFALGTTSDPETDLVNRGGKETLTALCTAGTWRVMDGAALEPAPDTTRADRARERALAALAG